MMAGCHFLPNLWKQRTGLKLSASRSKLRSSRVTSALMGASSVNQIKNNLEAVRNLNFSAEEEEKIDRDRG